MNTSKFRQTAHRLVDWIADYLEDTTDYAVLPDVKPGDVRAAIKERAPDDGEGIDAIVADFFDHIMPGITHWNHPGFFAYFPANHSPPSILAEFLTAALGAQCMSWETSPAATELEEAMMQWLAQLLELPDGFTGVIQDTASSSTLVSLLTAREQATSGDVGRKGFVEAGQRWVIYTSEQAHSSVDKAVKLAGFGLDNLRKIAVDDDYAMRPEKLAEAIDADRKAGAVPLAIVATVGTTSSTAVDPLPEIAEIADDRDLWLHVDAAYAGSAAILPEKRWILDGVEGADSFVFNPHKWLLTNFDCSAYFVRNVDALVGTFRASPEYLKTVHDDDVSNFRDWGIPLGRRFRALKLWFVMRSYGADGLRAMLRKHIALAGDFRRAVEEHRQFEVLAPSPFGLVCFRYAPQQVAADRLDDLNRRLLEALRDCEDLHLTHTRLGGDYCLRMSIGQWKTDCRHVEGAWETIQSVAAQIGNDVE